MRKDFQGAGPDRDDRAVGPERERRSRDKVINMPYAADARGSVKMIPITKDTPGEYGIRGDEINFGTNQESNVRTAERYDSEGYDMAGLNIRTGRTKATKYSGAK